MSFTVTDITNLTPAYSRKKAPLTGNIMQDFFLKNKHYLQVFLPAHYGISLHEDRKLCVELNH
jgi:hypothetical protein